MSSLTTSCTFGLLHDSAFVVPKDLLYVLYPPLRLGLLSLYSRVCVADVCAVGQWCGLTQLHAMLLLPSLR